jgi:hypothetical protein
VRLGLEAAIAEMTERQIEAANGSVDVSKALEILRSGVHSTPQYPPRKRDYGQSIFCAAVVSVHNAQKGADHINDRRPS